MRAASALAHERGFASIGAWLWDDREGSWETLAASLLVQAETSAARAALSDEEVLAAVRDRLYFVALEATRRNEARRAGAG